MGPNSIEDLSIDCQETPEIVDGGHLKPAEEVRNLLEGALDTTEA